MNSFLTTLAANTSLNVEELEIGYGDHGLSFAANLDGKIPSLPTLLKALGLTVPNNGAGLASTQVSASLSYEHSRHTHGSAAYSAVAKLTLTGAIQLGDIFDVVDVPTTLIPTINKIELSFEQDKSTVNTGNGTTNTTQTTKSTSVGFQLSFTTTEGKSPNIVVGTYQSYQQNNTKITGFAGTIHSADNNWMQLGFAKNFPVDITIKNPFVVHTTITNLGRIGNTTPSTLTLLGTDVNLATKPTFSSIPAIGDFIKEAHFTCDGVHIVYANSVIKPSSILIANQFLGKVGLPALKASATQTTSTIAKGLNVRSTGSIGATINMNKWIASWPSGYVPTEVLSDVASFLPSFNITELDFEYHQGTKYLSLGAKASIDVNANLSATPIPFDLTAVCETISNKKAWIVKGVSLFTTPITFADIMNGLLNTFGIDETVPSSLSILNLSVTSLSFSYNTSTHEFDFSFTLNKPASFTKLTGNDTQNSNHTFSTFNLIRKSTAGSKVTQLSVKIDAGMQLEDLLDLQGDLPATLNPTLDQVDFTMLLEKANAGTTNISGDTFEFSTTFTDDEHQFEFSGAYSKVTGGTVTNKIFGGNIHSPTGGTIDMGTNFPIDLKLKDLFIAKVSVINDKKNKTFSVFGSELTLGVDIDLSTLPAVGQFLSEAKFKFNSLKITYAKETISAKELKVINTFLKEIDVPPLITSHVTNTSTKVGASPVGFPAGYSLQGSIILGDNAEVIPLHTAFNPSTKPVVSTTGTNTSNITKGTTGTPVGKKFGPVTIGSIGLGTRDGGIGLKFTGSIALGPLTFDLIGFEITSPVSHFDPDISIQGLGLGVKKGTLSLEGLMMEGEVKVPQAGQPTPATIKAYTGSLSIQYSKYTLAAIGSYAQLPSGDPTMFLYAFLGTPLGGPPVFFVTGVAAGFGYNRTLTLPSPLEVSSYPLITPVMGTPTKEPLQQQFDAMNLDFVPKSGDFWGAVGVRGESFKMVESFILLDVKLGKYLEIDIIGLSNMTFPKQKEEDTTPPLAKLSIGVVARIIPEEGIVTVNGAFQPGSYVLNPMATISGGFGMLTVFKDQVGGEWAGAKEGDFVLTLGGYAKSYQPKSYYPKPARLALNWVVIPPLTIKASAYLAITPNAFMAGGSFAALFKIGGAFSISASFVMGADFIIYWKPYHYKAAIYIGINVKASLSIDLWLVTIHLSIDLDLGANLNVWGPHFAGTGVVQVHVLISFSVHVSFGDTSAKPTPIDWDTFKKSFLPEITLPNKSTPQLNILTSSISSGLVASQSSQTTHVVNAKEFAMVCNTAFPIKELVGVTLPDTIVNGKPVPTVLKQEYGIKPMAMTAQEVTTSTLTIAVTRNGGTVPNSDFAFKPVTKNMPAALWTPATTSGTIPETDSEHLIEGLCAGFTMKATSATKDTPTVVTPVINPVLYTKPATTVNTFDYSTSNFEMTA